MQSIIDISLLGDNCRGIRNTSGSCAGDIKGKQWEFPHKEVCNPTKIE